MLTVNCTYLNYTLSLPLKDLFSLSSKHTHTQPDIYLSILKDWTDSSHDVGMRPPKLLLGVQSVHQEAEI